MKSQRQARIEAEAESRATLGGAEWSSLRSLVWRGGEQFTPVRSELLRIAASLSDRLADERPIEREWAPLGVEVKPVSMVGHGSCSTADRSRIIYVNEKDQPALQRFTVAHELGHLLLMDSGSRRRLHPRTQEKLCDAFASALLIPRDRLSAALADTGLPPSPADLIRLCGRFRVNVRPMFFAIGEQLEESSDFLVYARYRGHRMRPDELAFRVEATTGARHAYFPPEQRLASVGLRNLVAASEEAGHGDSIVGVDSDVILGLRGLKRGNTSDSVRGPVAWRAFRSGKEIPYIVAVIDLAGIRDEQSPGDQSRDRR